MRNGLTGILLSILAQHFAECDSCTLHVIQHILHLGGAGGEVGGGYVPRCPLQQDMMTLLYL